MHQLPITGATIPRYGQAAEVWGLPPTGRCVTLTNSERRTAGCGLRWWFRHSERLAGERAWVLEYGTGWHTFLNDLWRWWALERPWPAAGLAWCPWCEGAGLARSLGPDREPSVDGTCERCDSTGLGPVARVTQGWRRDWAQADPPPFDQAQLDRECEKLRRAAEGYLATYGAQPPELVRVLDVEVSLARPILGSGGRPYCGRVPLVQDGDLVRFARHGDRDVTWVAWPWYQVGRLDAVAQDRDTGRLFTVEHKSTGQPSTFLSGLTVDPQTTGYLWLLEHAARVGRFGELPQRPVAGGLYDVASSSYQHDPQALKRGGWSRAMGRTVPSWRFRRALQLAGDDPAPYQDHLDTLRERFDRRLYQRELFMLGAADLARYDRELYAVATRHADLRRAAYRTPPELQPVAFYRTPICNLPGGGCGYRAPCANDTPETRSRYTDQGSDLTWTTTTDTDTDDTNDQADPGLGF